MNAYERWLEKQAKGNTTSGHTPTSALDAPDAPHRRVTCSFSGCDEPPCGHSQACRGHACCRQCTVEQAADAAIAEALAAKPEPPAPLESVAVGVAAEPDALAEAVAMAAEVPMANDARPEVDTCDDLQERDAMGEAPWPPEESNEATRAPLVAVGALLRHVLGGPPQPTSVPPPRALGSGPPRLTLRGQLRALLAEDDQPTLRAALAKRRARETAPPAATGGSHERRRGQGRLVSGHPAGPAPTCGLSR
jgi:hypothetical protein